jgi:hypothetical protein
LLEALDIDRKDILELIVPAANWAIALREIDGATLIIKDVT